MGRPRIDNSRVNRERLREEAAERLEAWQAMSPAEQLKALDQRLGKGEGATKQRARILAQLEASNKATENEAKVTEQKKSKKAKKA